MLGFYKADCQDTVKVVGFRVVNGISGSPVELAHVINMNQREAAIADLLGYFTIPIKTGDTLSVTSLGYFKQLIYCWGQYSKDSVFFTIKLKPRSYMLKELQFTWFSDYDKFLKGVQQLQLPITKEEERINRITEYFRRSIRKLDLIDLPQPSSGFVFGKDWLAKQNEQLKEKLEKERIRRVIERKYSAGIVQAITGLSGSEVFWFMEYCALTDEYLIKASDYDIRLKILDKFKIYHQDKPTIEKK